MNVDLYTKAVLTVIAACLLYTVFKDVSIVPEAYGQNVARSAPPPPTIMKVDIASVGGREIRRNSSVGIPLLPVEVKETVAAH